MSAQHTPAPWRIEGYTRLIGGEVIGHTISHGVNSYADGPAGYVCTTNGTSEADAILIAAAPDLLEALQYVLSAHGEQLTDAFEQAQKAIARATGAPT